MGVISTLRKHRKLRRISRALGAPLDPSRFLDDLTSGKPSKRERALEDLLDLCESDALLRQTMEAQGADRETLRDLYKRLIASGAGQWVGGYFVAVAALGYGFPLRFLLQNRDTLPWDQISVLLIEYFERDDVGPVPLELRGPSNPDDLLTVLWQIEQRLKREE